MIRHDMGPRWHCRTHLIKKAGMDLPDYGVRTGDLLPQGPLTNDLPNPLTIEGNLPTIGGISVLIQRAITLNPSTSSTGAALQAFSNAAAKIGVGISTAAAAKTQTGLQGATKTFKGMATTAYPSHTDGTASTGTQTFQFRSTFTTTEANHVWAEWAVCNSSGGRYLNRKVEALGTKTSVGAWDLTVSITLTT